jgi:hypothetical protein
MEPNVCAGFKRISTINPRLSTATLEAEAAALCKWAAPPAFEALRLLKA